MTQFDYTLDEFGRSIGIEGLKLRDDGSLVLNMQSHGTLAFELIGPQRDDISMSLARRIELSDDLECSRILELCHYREPGPFPTRAGLTRKGDLIFAVAMDTSEFTLPNVHETLDWLLDLHQQSEAFVSLARVS